MQYLKERMQRMQKFKDRIRTYAPIVTLLTMTAVFTVAAWQFKSNSSQLQSLNDLRQGLGICGSRLAQSMVSLQAQSLLSKNLQKGFLEGTDQCFSQVKNLFRAVEGKAILSSVGKEMTLLTDGAYVFSQKISDYVNKSSQRQGRGSLNEIGSQFNQLENYRFQVDQQLASAIKLYGKGQSLWEVMMAFSFFCLTLMSVFFFVRGNRKFENPYQQEAELADFYGQQESESKVSSESVVTQSAVVEAVQEEPVSIKDESGRYQPISLMRLFNSTKEMFAKMDHEIPFPIHLSQNIEDFELIGDEESLQQLFYNVFAKLIANYRLNPCEGAKISIHSQGLDDYGRIHFQLSNILFSVSDLEELKDSKDMNSLMIAELVEQLNGRIEFKNILLDIDSVENQASLFLELPINPIFAEERPATQRYISNLFKGKKKDLKNWIESQEV